ncbi:uncharacterized protein BBA_05967 [Beauveria bassiana ARSEF 2860]|uniref:Uncharacterized protein n=1 Tax=Beauveria bassiana (strain ARSEF 2860) TaxID=655819 RepID=J4UL65_BEAB2|nr:uncharacterized protein BBA_05967 [Beauveria bassiana ARSEF 2860]EJP65197.1 hypothetical protein BBA_05967 [Beauveria bassiana ARSEF 2860]
MRISGHAGPRNMAMTVSQNTVAATTEREGHAAGSTVRVWAWIRIWCRGGYCAGPKTAMGPPSPKPKRAETSTLSVSVGQARTDHAEPCFQQFPAQGAPQVLSLCPQPQKGHLVTSAQAYIVRCWVIEHGGAGKTTGRSERSSVEPRNGI